MTDKDLIFKFWSKVRGGDKIHPADKEIFQRVGKTGHRLRLECLPCPFTGKLKTATVVFLFLSPGYNPRDLKDARTISGKRKYIERRAGLLPISEKGSGAEWFNRIVKPFQIDLKIARERIAILDIGAYHSKNFHDYPLLAALPSSRASLDWAQSILFPQAIRKKRVVVCMRSAHFWGLKTGTNFGNLFVPEVTRGGYLKNKTRKQQDMKEQVIKAVQKAIN